MSTPSVDAITLPALSMALDAAVIRQEVIANNIANVHTEGFRARQVSFDAVLKADSSGMSGELHAQLSPASSLSTDGAVRLDQEMASMAQNGVHYQAVLRALNRYLSVMASAVSEGKR